ncbi:hypothetical protein PPL_04054 [Heterostelium album PN500]|uniref:Uncharacterized protein n=1 Tax=Heterostelium pallidum (strain ATCC 26659 / Pp 5 / PN500) TaxID=670386 RepID=D3B5W6_HETP5|nr:hypothetical protein PPL_04054 [Heterostelium album PN500]EFA83264.1 hypothetical protein PPL_04054 [Heterostelium album PN500]|eukprot:XP_020435381.1 hypothetical protein PPL_04054 [Heterostelium album PN500]
MTVENINDLPKFVLIEIFKNLNSKYICQEMPRNPFFHNYCYDNMKTNGYDSYSKLFESKSSLPIINNNINDPVYREECGMPPLNSTNNSNSSGNTATTSKKCVGSGSESDATNSANGASSALVSSVSNINMSEQEVLHEKMEEYMCVYLNNIINLSLVCKMWAKQIVPISNCCITKIVNKKQFATLFKYMTEGIIKDGATCLFTTIKFFCKGGGSSPNQLLPKDYKLLFNHCHSVRCLSFDKNQLTIGDVVVLSKYIKESANITELKAPSNFTPQGLALFCDALKYNQSLTLLDISSTPLNADCIGSICSALKVNRSILYLDLSFNSIGSNGVGLGDMLKCNTTLRSLFLIGNELDDESVYSISDALRTKNSTLTELSLSENDFGDDVGAAIGNVFKENRSIKTLDISCNELSEMTSSAFAESLTSNVTLQNLNVSDCSLALDNSGAEFFSSIQQNTTLTHLVLWGCDLNKQDLKDEIASLLCNNKSITTLSLGYNTLSSDDILTIVRDGLQYNTTLKSLTLNNNHICGKGGKIIADYLKTNATLLELSLFDNLVDNITSISFLTALTMNHVIQKLCLGSNRICPNISSKYKKILAYNHPVCPNQKQHWVNAKHRFIQREIEDFRSLLSYKNEFSRALQALYDLLAEINLAIDEYQKKKELIESSKKCWTITDKKTYTQLNLKNNINNNNHQASTPQKQPHQQSSTESIGSLENYFMLTTKALLNEYVFICFQLFITRK